MEFSKGRTFLNWSEFQIALEDWAIQDQFEFNVIKKDRKRARYICQHSSAGCQWGLSASYNKELEIEVKSLTSKHTCAGIGKAKNSVSIANQQSWLRRVIPIHLFITKATKTQDIIDCIRMQYGQTTSYKELRLIVSDGVATARTSLYVPPR